jgi:hypothetical protein
MASYNIGSSTIKEMEGPIVVVYGIKLQCEGPSQVANIERA